VQAAVGGHKLTFASGCFQARYWCLGKTSEGHAICHAFIDCRPYAI